MSGPMEYAGEDFGYAGATERGVEQHVTHAPEGEDAMVPGPPHSKACVVLDGDDSCIAFARHWTVDYLTQLKDDHGPAVSERARDLAQLVVSELVTNAYKHAPGPARMELHATGDRLHITVCDSQPVLPSARAADPERVGQHGLEIVAAITDSLDIQPEAGGKCITARLPLTDTPTTTGKAV